MINDGKCSQQIKYIFFNKCVGLYVYLNLFSADEDKISGAIAQANG